MKLKSIHGKEGKFEPIEVTIVLDSKAEALLFAKLFDVADFRDCFKLPKGSATTFGGDDDALRNTLRNRFGCDYLDF